LGNKGGQKFNFNLGVASRPHFAEETRGEVKKNSGKKKNGPNETPGEKKKKILNPT